MVIRSTSGGAKYRNFLTDSTNGADKTSDEDPYFYEYYVCRNSKRERSREKCPSSEMTKRIGVRLDKVDHQFGLVLNLITPWHEDELPLFREIIGNMSTEEVDPLVNYQKKKLDLEQQRKQVHRMFKLSTITEAEYLQMLEEIRMEEKQLVIPPVSRASQLEQYIAAAKYIATVGDQWTATIGKPSLRKKLVAPLLEPNGLIYDVVKQIVVGLRPRPDMYPVISHVLLRHGWEEREPGLLWNENVSTLIMPLRKNRYYQVMEALKQGLTTARDIARAIGMLQKNVHPY